MSDDFSGTASPHEPLANLEAPPPAPSRPRGPGVEPTIKRMLVTALVYLLFFQAANRLPLVGIGFVALSTAVSLLLTLLFTAYFAQASTTKYAPVLALAAAVVALPQLGISLLIAAAPGLPLLHHAPPRLFVGYLIILTVVPGLYQLGLAGLAAAIGAAVTRLIKSFNMLLPMALVLALVDLYVVFGGGLVTQAQTGHAPVAAAAMNALTVRMPRAVKHAGAEPMELAVGFADYLFIGLFFAAFRKFGVPSRRSFAVLFIVLALYMAYVALSGTPMPALVPIAAVVIGMNLTRFRYKRQEAFAMLYAGCIVTGIMGWLFYRSHH